MKPRRLFHCCFRRWALIDGEDVAVAVDDLPLAVLASPPATPAEPPDAASARLQTRSG